MITAYITFLVVLIGYCTGCVPAECLNIVDYRVLRVRSQTSPVWTRVLERVVLMFSDQQIVTGIAILVAGYSEHCTISVYHYQIVVYLAWLSSGTHLVTVTVLRKYLREEATMRTWRVAGMLVIFVLLVVALFPMNASDWSELANGIGEGTMGDNSPTGSAVIPAQCFWNTGNWTGWNSYSLVSYLFLVFSYVAKAGALFVEGESFLRKWLREKPGKSLKKGIDRSFRYAASGPRSKTWIRKIPFVCLLAIFALAKSAFDLYGSFIASLLYLFLVLFMGSWQVFSPRWYIPAEMLDVEGRSSGFGQVIPLLLLALPLLAGLEIYRGKFLPSIEA